MPESEYAKAAVVFGFQTMLAGLVDLGVGGVLVSLIGIRSNSPDVVGRYIAAARHWRRVSMSIMLPVGSLGFLIVYGKHGWAFGETITLLLCVLLSVYFTGWTSWASAPLLLKGKLRQMYFASITGSIIRLGGCVALFAIGRIDAVTIGLLGVVVGGVTALLYWRAALPFMNEPAKSDSDARTEIRKLVSPLIPGTFFYAFQGQVSMLLISLFGTAQGIAEVTALGRLGQVITLLGALYSTLVAPYFAQLPRWAVRIRYGVVCGATIALGALMSLLTFIFPEYVLLILGSKYVHLVREVGWLVLGSSILLMSTAMTAMHMARKWIFWRTMLMHIVLVVVVQTLFVIYGDMSTTIGVIYMGVATNVAVLMCLVIGAYLGFRSER